MSRHTPLSLKGPPSVVNVPETLRIGGFAQHEKRLTPDIAAKLDQWVRDFAAQQAPLWDLEVLQDEALHREFGDEPEVLERARRAIDRGPVTIPLSELTPDQVEVVIAIAALDPGLDGLPH